MIVDLARNDLGRVCEFGSVRVPALCAIEHHPGLYHLVSTVTGRLRPEVDLADVVRATFPPASVTGAPKPRVMQAIEDLEPVRRGVYCGAVGWVDADRGRPSSRSRSGRSLIGTRRGTTYLGVGGGIVADSQPDDEWAETELKAARLLAAAGRRVGTRLARSAVIIWLNGELVPLEAAADLAARSRARGRRRRVRDVARVPRRSVRLDPPPRASPRFGVGTRPRRARRERAARGRRCGARRERSHRSAPAHHRHRRPAPPGSRRAPVPPTVFLVGFPLEPWPRPTW